MFLCPTWNLNPELTSNKPTNYLRDYGDFTSISDELTDMCQKQIVFTTTSGAIGIQQVHHKQEMGGMSPIDRDKIWFGKSWLK